MCIRIEVLGNIYVYCVSGESWCSVIIKVFAYLVFKKDSFLFQIVRNIFGDWLKDEPYYEKKLCSFYFEWISKSKTSFCFTLTNHIFILKKKLQLHEEESNILCNNAYWHKKRTLYSIIISVAISDYLCIFIRSVFVLSRIRNIKSYFSY